MNADLAKQQEAFKKSLQQQPVIQRKLAASVTVTASTNSAANSASTSSIESLSEELRFDDSSVRHINSYVHAIISFLKPVKRQVSFEEIKECLNIDIDETPELIDRIKRNDRITVINRLLSYNYVYNVKNGDDLIDLLRDRVHHNGILVQELKESCPDIDKIIQEKIRTGEIVAIKGKDDQPRVLFYNEQSGVNPIDEKFKTLWASLQVPMNEDLEAHLARAGLKSVGVAKSTAKAPAASNGASKTARKFNKRTRITNTHIEGLDFSVDMPKQPK